MTSLIRSAFVCASILSFPQAVRAATISGSVSLSDSADPSNITISLLSTSSVPSLTFWGVLFLVGCASALLLRHQNRARRIAGVVGVGIMVASSVFAAVLQTTNPDSGGTYSFTGVADGIYSIEFSQPGYETRLIDPVIINGNVSLTDIDAITLFPEATPTPVPTATLTPAPTLDIWHHPPAGFSQTPTPVPCSSDEFVYYTDEGFPDTGIIFQIGKRPGTGSLASIDSGTIHYRINGGAWQTTPIDNFVCSDAGDDYLSGNDVANAPGGDTLEYYFEVSKASEGSTTYLYGGNLTTVTESVAVASPFSVTVSDIERQGQ